METALTSPCVLKLYGGDVLREDREFRIKMPYVLTYDADGRVLVEHEVSVYVAASLEPATSTIYFLFEKELGDAEVKRVRSYHATHMRTPERGSYIGGTRVKVQPNGMPVFDGFRHAHEYAGDFEAIAVHFFLAWYWSQPGG